MTAAPRTRGTTSSVVDARTLDAIAELLRVEDSPTVNTSMRIPEALRDAAALAVEHLGVATSTTLLTTDALRHELETVLLRGALDALYEEDPQLRPTLAQTAHALAQIDGSPLAGKRSLIDKAAREVVKTRPDATADDVLLWAEAQLAVKSR